ncbi:MAG: bifunctional (p)ppGpp synthetase/guanosine-3',5'-bis(diphosphate) 3'-pyrophosphohydrolase [Bacteroidales bacterium]|nr:bifunctional (p)ppGpp synthetase/guanosine-3',5'-bis(diphosphate) 3'-pyrophosphohydrolase [Bacteroidales bacterium]MBN2757822.1 bifunctional (p)ppGpp synthetase/guanosine-3',5'-bis(diphosphate) 3'-pyrophosphohydrolase [Bacteroidales bacterium]
MTDSLVKKFSEVLNETDKVLFEKAINYVIKKKNIIDINELDCLEKSLNIAKIGQEEMNSGISLIVSCILFYCFDNEVFNFDELQNEFNNEIADIVNGLYKSPNFELSKLNIQSENFIKLMLTISKDVRSILIKIAEYLYLLRNLNNKALTIQTKIAAEVSVLFAPIAHRLGLYAIKSEMEDLVMKYIHPQVYREIAKKLDKTKESRSKYIKQFISPLDSELKKSGLKCEIKGRPKSIFSIWNKMSKQDVDFEEVYDKFAIRIIIDSPLETEKDNCWKVYSIITDKYLPNPKRLRDWISTPKNSGYESLHTTVIGPEQKWVEVQIRTKRMDEIAEKGHAAHWKYKENREEKNKSEWLAKMREALEKPDESLKNEQDENKSNLYTDEIFIFTPKGDLKRLKAGYSVLDFAFSIHSSVGETCTGAIVNDKIVTIKHILKNGDNVKILNSKNQKPKYEWLEIVKSTRAKAKIKRAIKSVTYQDSDLGKELVKQKFSQLKIVYNDLNIRLLTEYFKIKSDIDFYQSIGSGKLDIHKIKKAFTDINEQVNEEKENVNEEDNLREIDDFKFKSNQDYLIIENNLNTVDYYIAKCCNPIPGDEIFGFITVSKGTRIHKKSCPNAVDLLKRYPYRVVKARWNTKSDIDKFRVHIRIIGKDRIGISNSIMEIISKEFKLNLKGLNIQARKNDMFEGMLVTDIQSIKQLNTLIDRLKKIEDIFEVNRIIKQ